MRVDVMTLVSLGREGGAETRQHLLKVKVHGSEHHFRPAFDGKLEEVFLEMGLNASMIELDA